MWNTQNVIGIAEDTSGNEVLEIAATQFEEYRTKYCTDHVNTITPTDDGDHSFQVEVNSHTVLTDRVVLATGLFVRSPGALGAQPAVRRDGATRLHGQSPFVRARRAARRRNDGDGSAVSEFSIDSPPVRYRTWYSPVWTGGRTLAEQ